MANERWRWWPSIAARWDSKIVLAAGGKICGEGTTTTTLSPPLYNSLPSERRGTQDATTAALPPPPISPVAININACAVQGLTTMMTMTTMTKSPGNPSSHPNHAAASRRCAPAQAAPTIPWTGVLPTRQITCDAPPAGPQSCHCPRGRQPADGANAFKGTACCRLHCHRCCRQPPPKDAAVLFLLPPHRRRHPSSSSTSPSPA
jgi:hypothetical protein